MIPVCGELTVKADHHTWGYSFISIDGSLSLTTISDASKSTGHSMNSFFFFSSCIMTAQAFLLLGVSLDSLSSELQEGKCVVPVLSHIHAALCSRCHFELGAWITWRIQMALSSDDCDCQFTFLSLLLVLGEFHTWYFIMFTPPPAPLTSIPCCPTKLCVFSLLCIKPFSLLCTAHQFKILKDGFAKATENKPFTFSSSYSYSLLGSYDKPTI